ncbi:MULTISPECIES: 30S ribosome-binding factor RbfA [unclassified Imperialibacter]|uniref:30S ribosome-binding factor RbfA n=1 Tax=unclassified Imperialibacter TaxID=2629706 RepID=UPI001257C921|nr:MULTISPECIES: 30S ribosome-binding factor RbfA [unclassified Imperialibacter]CAD5270085.1 Ribosome-binding factor A [Imperialibacter sp. 89]CAD5297990.1 Ribosome-binding factor A [Imperialibacter sp. 75]VVT34258.1 Ribosome-binding factor A [Imperialibacter sp. EC-SDR9]
MESTRQQKYARLIQKELGEIFQRDTKHMFGKAFITITLVKMSPDLGFAKVYLSIFMASDRDEMLAQINERKSQVRKLLGQRIGKQVRIIPEIAFFIDDTEDHARKMDSLINSLDIPPADEENEETEG